MDNLLDMITSALLLGGNQPVPSVPSNDTELNFNEKETSSEVRVLRKNDKSADSGRMRSIEFLVEMSRHVIFTESGVSVFCDYIIALLKSHNPFISKNTIVSISIEGGDNPGYSGMKFRPIEEITIGNVIDCVLHSNNNLDATVPRATVNFMYFNSNASQ
ncbi:unnamed protein product [Caenorhabditis nigoni]